jgi:hypothetical protein
MPCRLPHTAVQWHPSILFVHVHPGSLCTDLQDLAKGNIGHGFNISHKQAAAGCLAQSGSLHTF